MIQIVIAGGLIEKMFETGNKTNGQIKVLGGLPNGARLVGVKYDNGYVSLYFTEPGRCDDRIVNIVLRYTSIP
jgi:hypothetical protein